MLITKLKGFRYLFQGLRPTIPKHTHPKLTELLEKCWQQDPDLRPDFSEILEMLQVIAKEVEYPCSLSFRLSAICFCYIFIGFNNTIFWLNRLVMNQMTSAKRSHPVGFSRFSEEISKITVIISPYSLVLLYLNVQ